MQKRRAVSIFVLFPCTKMRRFLMMGTKMEAALSVFIVITILIISRVSFAEPESNSLITSMRTRGLSAQEIILPFAQTKTVRTFARQVKSGSFADASQKDLAHHLYNSILALRKSGAIIADPDNTPKRRPPKTADQLLRIAQNPGDYDRRAGCYEFSILYVALARAMGIDAVGVERIRTSGVGQIGHIMVGVRLNTRLSIFDLQNQVRGSRALTRELSDMEFAAHHYNHIAVAAFLNKTAQGAHSAEQARIAIDLALRLAPKNPGFLNNRATILLGQGHTLQALADATYAIFLAPRVALYRYQRGRILLAAREPRRALGAFDAAIQLHGRYALAIRDKGRTLMRLGLRAEGLRTLERATKIAPTITGTRP